MKNDIRPTHRIDSVSAPVRPLPAAPRLVKKRAWATYTVSAAAVLATVSVVGIGINALLSDSGSEASKKDQPGVTTQIASEEKASAIPNWRHRRHPELVVPGVPDPVETIPELIKASPTARPSATPVVVVNTADLNDPAKKDIAMQLVSSAENSTLNWRSQYSYIQDIGDGRGYTGGIIGFTSGTHDMLELVAYYNQLAPGNVLSKYIPALERVDGTSSHSGLDPNFVADWKVAANDIKFQQAQDHERDVVYFNPAMQQAKADGLRTLGQFIYYDALVMHGPGSDSVSFGGIRAKALSVTKAPSQGGNETAYLNAFLDARKAAMLTEAAHEDTSRVDTQQRVFLRAGNFYLNPPLSWQTYGDNYSITR